MSASIHAIHGHNHPLDMNGGFNALSQVFAGIDAAIEAGLAPVKINTVIKRGRNDHIYSCVCATEGIDLRAALRAGDRELGDLIQGSRAQRNDRYRELREELRRSNPDQKKIGMYDIGG